MITLIACVSKNFAIGKGNDLVFSLREDMYFSRLTPCTSLSSLGQALLVLFLNQRLLKNRGYFVLCSEKDKTFVRRKGL